MFGHILVIPEFGVVSLGEVEVGEKMYEGSDEAQRLLRTDRHSR